MIVTPTRRSGIAELLGSKPKSRPVRQVAPKCFPSAIPEPDNWLKNITDETLEKDQVLWGNPVRYFRGSNVGDPCLRSLCLAAMGHKLPIDANLRRIFEAGKNIEKFNVDALRKAELLEYSRGQQIIIYEKVPINGHVDALINREGRINLVEIKSINEWPYKQLPKEHGYMLVSQSPLFKIKTPHKYLMQWNCYCCAPYIFDENEGQPISNNLEEGVILFEEKNTSNQKFYWLKKDEELAEKMIARLRLGMPYIMNEPMCIPPKSIEPDADCKTCFRKYLCKHLPDRSVSYKQVRAMDKELRG